MDGFLSDDEIPGWPPENPDTVPLPRSKVFVNQTDMKVIEKANHAS